MGSWNWPTHKSYLTRFPSFQYLLHQSNLSSCFVIIISTGTIPCGIISPYRQSLSLAFGLLKLAHPLAPIPSPLFIVLKWNNYIHIAHIKCQLRLAIPGRSSPNSPSGFSGPILVHDSQEKFNGVVLKIETKSKFSNSCIVVYHVSFYSF